MDQLKVPALTVESWARNYITSKDLSQKCAPPPVPPRFEEAPTAEDLRPGRPQELHVTRTRPKSFKPGALTRIDARAELHHRFWHHELQAAELMCWALVRFVDTPVAFKKGLLRIFADEVRHMQLYEKRLRSLGYQLGDFEVRDWFWERVPTCQTPLAFVALLGMGLEAANLDHTERFGTWFRAVDDEESALIQDQVGKEEIAHVRFATRWFKEWTGAIEFDAWCEALPPPLTPLLMRGKTLHRERRRKAAFPEEFSDALGSFEPTRRSPRPQR